MFSDLIEFLETKTNNSQIAVRDLHNSCCDSTRVVFDFNEIKTRFYAGEQEQEPRSVAGLLFCEINRLWFVQPCDYYVLGGVAAFAQRMLQ